jgi:small subunit ribosomal protein S24e
MEIKILEERPNPLMKRHEYRFEIAHATAATPSRDQVRGELSKIVKAPKDRVIIERMNARYGTAVTRGDALVYESAEAAKATSREHILVRNGLKERTPKGGAPAAAPAEAPAAATPAPAAAPAAAPAETKE